MSSLPKVSIILVNYNGYRDTIECLLSLREITYSNHDVIVIDNASTNESVKKISEKLCEDEILIASEVNGGFSAGNNIGIKYAIEHDADYCLLLNNDTVVDPAFLSALIDTAEKHERNAVITSKILYFFDQTKIWYAGGSFNRITSRTTHVGINEIDMGQYDQEKEVSFISGCCMLLPREVIKKIGLLDEDYFLYCEDLAYCCEITKGGYGLIYEPKSVVYHKVNASTGKALGSVAYYTSRNKLYIIHKYITGINLIIAYVYHLLECFKRILTKEYSGRAIRKSFHDYRNHIVGQLKDNLVN